MTARKSPVWPPFPGFGYAGAYEPVIADQMVAERQTPAARKAHSLQAARANAQRQKALA